MSVSICILAHNSANFVNVAVESVLAQSDNSWQVVICDDASTDDTEKCIRPYLRDARIDYHRHLERIGQAANWTFALRKVKHPVIATLHADDAYNPDAVEHIKCEFRNSSKLDLLICGWVQCDAELRPTLAQFAQTRDQMLWGTQAIKYLATNNCALPSATVFTRDLVKRVGFPERKYEMVCDREYILRLSGAARLTKISKHQITRYRVHNQNITSEFLRTGRVYDETFNLQASALSTFAAANDRGESLAMFRAKIARDFVRAAIAQHIRHNNDGARKLLRYALATDSRVARRWKSCLDMALIRAGAIGRLIAKLLHPSA